MPELLRRFPALVRTLPRVNLRVAESPLERITVDGASLLLKRDDLSAPSLGGNKVRALEFLLAGAGPDDTLLTVGSTGSTHALSVAHYATRVGAACEVITWPQEENDVSRATSARLAGLARVTAARSVADAFLRAVVRRARRKVRWIPAGGSSPLGALAHANATFEMLAQLERAGIALPDTLVLPLGSGGTTAGTLLGLSLARVPVHVVGVRVVPGIVGSRRRVLALARRTRRLLESLSGAPLAPIDEVLLEIDASAYGGAYARETDASRNAARLLREAGGPLLDGTYSAKAFAVALERARRAPDERVLFWLTFDGRWLSSRTG